jgi:hypothetical protein
VREPETIRRHRCIARAALVVIAFATLVATAQTASAGVPRLAFPVVGNASYEDDFGAPRGAWSHQGNDILAARKAPVVAVEGGKIEIWTSSATAGCMLYLYGKSGTTYLYIHLNNDRGARNDNKGGCRPGIAYAPGLHDGEVVRAGELIGYVGDSGDADGGPTHLHFELHPGDGDAVSPYRYLRRAQKLLFAVPKDGEGRELQRQATLTLTGTVVRIAEPPPSATDGSGAAGGSGAGTAPPPPPPPSRHGVTLAAGSLLTIRVTTVVVSSGGRFSVTRTVTLAVAAGADLAGIRRAGLTAGTRVTVTTTPVTLSLAAQKALPGALAAASVTAA